MVTAKINLRYFTSGCFGCLLFVLFNRLIIFLVWDLFFIIPSPEGLGWEGVYSIH